MLVFGGLHYLTSCPPVAACLSDTWAFDGNDWINLASAGVRPLTRRGAAAVYDAVNDRLVVFGGQHLAYLPDVPAEPTGLTATLPNETTVLLNWTDNAESETSYILRRGYEGGSLQTIATLPPDSQTYTDSTVASCGKCTYVVHAASDYATSPDSNPASIVADLTPPTLVCSDIVMITEPGQSSAVVNFTLEASDNCNLLDSGSLPASGSVFQTGVTTVNAWAKDEAGLKTTGSFTVTVLTPAEAVQGLIALVNDSDSPHKQPLLASLEAALTSLQCGNVVSAVNQLLAFQNQVRAQVEPLDSAWAASLNSSAQRIIVALIGGATNPGGRPHGRFTSVRHHPGGTVELQFSAPAGPVYLVEASTNLVDWEAIGAATKQPDGSFEFDDPGAAKLPNRFYRVVTPE